MELFQRKPYSKEYRCDITYTLDKLCSYSNENSRFVNYLLDCRDIWSNTFAIRVPGRTVGTVELGDSNEIIKCMIATDCIGKNKSYPENTNEMLKQFLGKTINNVPVITGTVLTERR